MTTRDSGWLCWTVEEWNEALFDHFFLDNDGKDRPVLRIPVTREELVKVVSDPLADPNEVQESFLKKVRTPSHLDYEHRLSGYHINTKTGMDSVEPPPFFFELAFSCLVASPPNGEISREGDFRKRLAKLLNHDVRHYPLRALAPLWRALSKWLDFRRAAGEPYRRLELPPEDYRVLIGYSINLAFPPRKDQLRLTELLSPEGFDGDPPISIVLDLVGNEINRFSKSFGIAYEEFRKAFGGNSKSDLEGFPFWGAIRDAIANPLIHDSDEFRDKGNLKLVWESDGVVLLLSTNPGQVINEEVAFLEADTPHGEFGSVLCIGDESDAGFFEATQRLLDGKFNARLKGKGWQAIKVAVDQGILLFYKTESLTWELEFTLQEYRECYAMVKNSLLEDFIRAFPKEFRLESEPAQYKGWSLVDLHLIKDWQNELSFSQNKFFADIRCLQPSVTGPRLFLIEGCPVDGGFLGITGCLPIIRATLSDAVHLDAIDTVKEKVRINLTLMDRDSNDFSFPDDLQKPLEGRYRIVGSLSNRILVQREVIFYPEIVVNEYKKPSDLNAWEIEAGGPDVLKFGEVFHGSPYQVKDQVRQQYKAEKKDTPSFNFAVPIQRLKSPPISWLKKRPVSLPKYSVWELEKLGKAARLMEVCGGLAIRRQGIPEGVLLNLVRDILGLNQYEQRWDVVRSLMETGYLDRLQFIRWRRTGYFPRVPKFILGTQGGMIRAVLFGLATTAIRNRADVELLGQGAEREQVSSFSPWVIPPPAWKSDSAEPYFKVSKYLGLEEPVWAEPLANTLWSMPDITANRDNPPQYYECSGCWDWDRGCFSQKLEQKGENVCVASFKRRDRPPYYQVKIDGDHVWWSTSRNWALLLAYQLKGEAVFTLNGDNQISRVSKGLVYLPLPIGIYLTKTGMAVPGPVGDGQEEYVYQFKDSKEREGLLAAIWGGAELNKKEMRRWARWILLMSKRNILRQNFRAVSLPIAIRQKLEQFHDIPEFHELSRTRLEPSLLPRLQEGLCRFTKSSGR